MILQKFLEIYKKLFLNLKIARFYVHGSSR
jgi:hypothetical protein